MRAGCGSAEAEPTLGQRRRIAEIDNALTVDKILYSAIVVGYLDVIPFVGLEKMSLVGVFFQNLGAGGLVGNAGLVAVVAAEAEW